MDVSHLSLQLASVTVSVVACNTGSMFFCCFCCFFVTNYRIIDSTSQPSRPRKLGYSPARHSMGGLFGSFMFALNVKPKDNRRFVSLLGLWNCCSLSQHWGIIEKMVLFPFLRLNQALSLSFSHPMMQGTKVKGVKKQWDNPSGSAVCGRGQEGLQLRISLALAFARSLDPSLSLFLVCLYLPFAINLFLSLFPLSVLRLLSLPSHTPSLC